MLMLNTSAHNMPFYERKLRMDGAIALQSYAHVPSQQQHATLAISTAYFGVRLQLKSITFILLANCLFIIT